MKKQLLALATGLCILAVTAQNSTQADSTATLPADTVATSLQASQSTMLHESKDPSLTEIDGVTYILNDGKCYKLESLIDDNNRNDIVREQDISQRGELRLVALGICFIVPCITLIIALIAVLVFLLNKNRTRAAIIGKAIDANYSLPDAFYSNQRPAVIDPCYMSPDENAGSPSMNAGMPDVNTSHSKWLNLQLTDPAQRDPKKFSTGATLVAIGLAMILFFCVERNASGMLLIGCIPFFLGVGNLIGYFYVPGYTSRNMRRDRYNQMHYNNQYHQNNATPGQPHSQHPGTPCPPPFPPEENR
ncbi:MAG: hypothetical protein K2H14_06640 [Muribaculaceae bacterium]|nr:hypothetical protein [Muribaculaceae bacterium]